MLLYSILAYTQFMGYLGVFLAKQIMFFHYFACAWCKFL